MDPLAAYTFRVWLGQEEYGFSKVSGLGRESEATVYQEGGLNNRVHVLPGVVKHPGVLRLERGAYVGKGFPFYLAGERLGETLRIDVRPPLPSKGEAQKGKVYALTGLWVKKWEVGGLDALQDTLLIDQFELNYEYIYISE
ncbi:MAG: phage tail protein [Oscillospiraceae bacterium]|nr:phage tail protein [Oscillospiraceae bacterium]